MKKGFSVFLIKTVILWVVIIGLIIMMFVIPKDENVDVTQNATSIEETTPSETAINDIEETNPLTMIGFFFGFGLLMTVIYLFGSRCPKCGQWFAMGKTINERVQTGIKSKTKTRSKFGLGAFLALFDWRLWWLGLRSGGSNSKTDERAIYGIKKTRFCLECGYEHTKMPK